MATSPDYLRLATSASRALADTALDSLQNAVLVVDIRHKHLPLVLCNTSARRCLASGEASLALDAPLGRFLGAGSALSIENTLAALAELKVATVRAVTWRFTLGDAPVMTEITPLAGPSPQRLMMLTFAPPAVQPALAAAVDQLPLELLLLDADLRVTYANTGAMRSGASIPGGVVGCSALMLTPTSMLSPAVFARALEGHGFRDDALTLMEPGRPTRWFEVSVQPLRRAGDIVGLIVLSVEVKESRVLQRAHSSSERRMLALTEHARDIITIADRDGLLQYVSGGVRNSLGYTSEERQSNSLFEHVHRDDLEVLRTQYRRMVAGEIEGFSEEFRVRHKDGSYRWLESSYSAAFDNPFIGGVVANSRDITERKQAEFKLAQREEVFRLAADAVEGIIFEWDVARGVVHRSRGVREVLGVEPEELEASAEGWWERIHPRDSAEVKKIVGLALLQRRGWTATYRVRDAQGRYRSILERGLIQRNAAGDPVRAIGCCLDVSEIKRLTDILAETQRIAKIGGWEYSYATEEMIWTDEMYRIYDTTPKDFLASWENFQKQCSPQSMQMLRDAFHAAEEAGGRLDLEMEIHTLGGQRVWVRVIGYLEMIDGKPFRAFGSMQNIQAKKVAQIALENSTGWLKLSMNMAHLHAWRWDRARDCFEFATLEGRQMDGPRAYPGMEKFLERVHPKERDAVRRAVDNAFLEHIEVREEFRLLGEDGKYHSYATTARPLFDGTDVPRGLVGVIQDVTAKREGERRLRESEELLRATTTNTADILFLVDPDLRVRFINRALNGLRVQEILGKEVGQLMPEFGRTAILAKLRHIFETGESTTYEFQEMSTGQARYFENRAVLVRDDGIGTAISISMRDITERKRLEQEILDVSGRERQSIGRDLHDGLGQELTGVALMLRGLATRIQTRFPEAVENVNEIVGLVNQSIDSARALARGLLPVRTESGGLTFALRALAERGRDLYGLDVSFRDSVAPQMVFDEADASHLYRIAQEALTNAARHGHATRVDIGLQVSTRWFSLTISDDGVGIAPGAQATNGMGLKIMKYRAGMIGARFKIEPNVPHGTRVRVTGEPPVPGRVQSLLAI